VRGRVLLKRSWRAALGLAGAVVLASVSMAAQASAVTTGPSNQPAGQASVSHLTAAQCAALRAQLHIPTLKCAHVMTFRLSPNTSKRILFPQSAMHTSRIAAASTTSYYWRGIFSADPFGSSTAWYVNDLIGVTFEHGIGVWNNSHTCTAHGTTLNWCGTWHNGYSNYMEEGFNFDGNAGIVRLEIDTYGNQSWGTVSSWAAVHECLGPPGYCY
jgi:hypothetical protein